MKQEENKWFGIWLRTLVYSLTLGFFLAYISSVIEFNLIFKIIALMLCGMATISLIIITTINYDKKSLLEEKMINDDSIIKTKNSKRYEKNEQGI